MAGKAKAELQRRGQERPTGEAAEPQIMATWWQDFQAHADAVDRAIDSEHQAAIRDGQPWPPKRKPEAGHEGPDIAVPGRKPQLEQSQPRVSRVYEEPEPQGIRPGTPRPEAAGPVPADHERGTRLDKLQSRAKEARRRIDAQRVELDTSSEQTPRIQREARAGPEADLQAETPNDMEMEP